MSSLSARKAHTPYRDSPDVHEFACSPRRCVLVPASVRRAVAPPLGYTVRRASPPSLGAWSPSFNNAISIASTKRGTRAPRFNHGIFLPQRLDHTILQPLNLFAMLSSARDDDIRNRDEISNVCVRTEFQMQLVVPRVVHEDPPIPERTR